VIDVLNSEKDRQAFENRKKICSVDKTIFSCGRLEIFFKRKYDSRRIDLNEEVTNNDKFCELLKFRVNARDDTLKKYLIEGNSNTQCTSIFSDMLSEKLVNKVN
jgi:hypothetical protein